MDKILRIGLVDDDPIFRLTAGKMIQSYTGRPTEILNFKHGLEAWEYFTDRESDVSGWPHVLFIDINMPFMNGWELLSALATEIALHPQAPQMYVLSSSTSLTDQEKAKTFPFLKGYILKPLKREELYAIFDQVNGAMVNGE
ncbi:response regulator [Chitinophagaceae bacterium MMS25-I14]